MMNKNSRGICKIVDCFGSFEKLPALLSFTVEDFLAEPFFQYILEGHYGDYRADYRDIYLDRPDLLQDIQKRQLKQLSLWRKCSRPTTAEWFLLLGKYWTDFDGMATWRRLLTDAFKNAKRAEIDEMMSPEEFHAWEHLPEKIPAFRGCSSRSSKGFSYSLDRAVAERFPTLNRYKSATPTLISALIPKRFAVVKIERNEKEIIAVRPDTITILRSDRI